MIAGGVTSSDELKAAGIGLQIVHDRSLVSPSPAPTYRAHLLPLGGGPLG
jgi:hypothetical protein